MSAEIENKLLALLQWQSGRSLAQERKLAVGQT
jgi:hypothetical protein